jgi:predicted dehydrogenase
VQTLDRRGFLRSAAALAAAPSLLATGCASRPVGEPPQRPIVDGRRRAPGEPLRIAVIGVGGQGAANLDAVRHEQIVALCDVDSAALDRAAAMEPQARTFVDFRELLRASDLDIDGVVISTPDHTHAAAAALAIRTGRAVYLEKPLSHSVFECRTLQRLAREYAVPTQMGTIIHAGDNYRRVVEAIRAGVIGTVTAVDCWCPKSWCCGRLTPGAVPPPNLDWALWQGPVAHAPYIEGIHPANWRSYWSYGTGTLGDMGCHILDLPFWALGLDRPEWSRCDVTAHGPKEVDPIGCPPWLEATWVFERPRTSEHVGLDPLILRWFDGSAESPTVQELGAKDRKDYRGRYMVCFQGTRGFLMANYGEFEVLMVPGAVLPKPSMPSSPGQHREWLAAIRAGAVRGSRAALSNFDYAAPLTELVLLGTVAYRSGTGIVWNRTAADGSTERYTPVDPTAKASVDRLLAGVGGAVKGWEL